MPGVDERVLLWKKAFPSKIQLANDINPYALAQKYELSGAEIINVVQFACLRALDRGEEKLTFNDLFEGIKREFQKEGRIMR
jgi:ATP-dependent 26S proteasome regulatory subunit